MHPKNAENCDVIRDYRPTMTWHRCDTLTFSMAVCIAYDTIRYEMLFYVRSKADTSQLNLPHGTNN